jgi:transcriptional antiterminator RfaH
MDGCLGLASDEYRWYAVHTLPHRELAAAIQLRFQGFQPFVPMHPKTVRHARRFKTIKAPFFPRYLFVCMNLARDRWRPINGTFGVCSLVMAGDLPTPVPHGVVEALTTMTDASGNLSFSTEMRPGQKVRILTGPFADRIGELTRADESDRVQILLDVMGIEVVVHAAARTLAPVA